MRILLIEDEPHLGEAVREHVAAHGHAVDWVQRLDDAEVALRSVPYDLALLDLHLPDGRGLDLLQAMRKAGDTRPVIILTARDQISDRIAGLNAGADDYLVKPFSLDELLARLRALVRRPSQRETPVLRHGPLAIDPRIRAAHFDGRELSLTPKEYALLELLVRQRGHVLSRVQIFEHLYDAQSDASDKVVEVIVSTLRGKLNAAGATELIQTRRGFGYVVN